MSAPLVVITDSNLASDGVEEGLLGAAGFEVVRADCRSPEDVIVAGAGADALIVQWAPITGAVIDRLDRCRVISRLGIGLDMIDLEAASSRGIAVLNTPDYCIEEVAAHAVALALALSRGLFPLDRSLRDGEWTVAPRPTPVVRPSAATFAVVGFGRIGRRVARVAGAVGYRVVVADPAVPAAEVTREGHTPAALDEALAQAQIVSLHLPLGERTRHLIDATALERMGEGSFLVNTSRGGLIDEEALARALRAGAIAGAALDVFEAEPLPAASPLREAPNLVLTPHAAWYSAQALAELPRRAAENVVEFFAAAPGSAPGR
jgi:D-3-phosphoglycerate dehydrogenase